MTAVAPATTASQAVKAVKDKAKPKKSKDHVKEQQVADQSEEKRPRTTEWEKFADMLAQIRKYNPQDAFRRGSTYTKFGGVVGGGIGHFKDRPFGAAQHGRAGLEDDGSDTTSNYRSSPQRSSARPVGSVQQLSNRPNTGNNRHNAGGHYAYKTRRSSNISSTTGRKFDYNPTRSRVNDFVSSSPFAQSSFLENTADTQHMPYALYSTSYEGTITPPNMTTHHSRSDLIALECEERARSRSQPPQIHQHPDHLYSAIVHNGNSRPVENDFNTLDAPFLKRQSTNISLSTNSSDGNKPPSINSSHLDAKAQQLKLPKIKNTSSFLATPRSPFSLRKSYTDLYFNSTSNKEDKLKPIMDKTPFKNPKSSKACLNKNFIQ